MMKVHGVAPLMADPPPASLGPKDINLYLSGQPGPAKPQYL